MTSPRSFACGLILFLPVLPASAMANERAYQSVWLVQPAEAEPGRLSVRTGDFVFKQRLLPPSLIRITTAIIDDENGRTMVEAGQQLFGVLTEGPPIFCQTSVPRPNILSSTFLGRTNRQHCFVDMDRDGRLDGHFVAGNEIKGLPNIRGRRPEQPETVSGGAYEARPSEELSIRYWVGARLDALGGRSVRSRPHFSIVFGTDENSDRLTSTVQPDRASDPPRVSILGGVFTVTSRRDDVLDISISHSIPSQPFSVITETMYY